MSSLQAQRWQSESLCSDNIRCIIHHDITQIFKDFDWTYHYSFNLCRLNLKNNKTQLFFSQSRTYFDLSAVSDPAMREIEYFNWAIALPWRIVAPPNGMRANIFKQAIQLKYKVEESFKVLKFVVENKLLCNTLHNIIFENHCALRRLDIIFIFNEIAAFYLVQ